MKYRTPWRWVWLAPMVRFVGSVALAQRLGARLRQLRQGENLTQKQVADTTNLTQGFLTLVETGSRLPSLGVLARLATALRVELWELFLDDTDPRVVLLDAIRREDWAAVDTTLVKLGRPPAVHVPRSG